MSARSQQFATDSDEGFNLVPALRDCLSPGVIVVNRQQANRFLHPGSRTHVRPTPRRRCKQFAFHSARSDPKRLHEILTHRKAHIVSELTIGIGLQPGRKFHVNAIPVAVSAADLSSSSR
jgi:hypothetical protein